MHFPSRRAVLVSLAAAPLAACGRRIAPHVPDAAPLVAPDAIRVRVEGRVTTVPLEEYIVGTVLAEISPAADAPATATAIFALQSILARTYATAQRGRHAAEGFDLCDSTHCQVYQPERLTTSRFAPLAQHAVSETRGHVLAFGRRPAQTLFHADCGGWGASADDVWGGDPVPYLTGGPDRLPDGVHRRWELDETADVLANALAADPRSDVGRLLSAIDIVSADASGRAVQVQVTGEATRILRGEHLRAIINARLGPTAVRSTRFQVERRGGSFHFAGTGYGHGVGLCQVGAMARLRRGDTVETVLAAYYPHTRVVAAGG